MAGYSQTPLVRKLGIGPGARVVTIDAPATFHALLEPLPDGVVFADAIDADSDLVHLFARKRGPLADALANCRATLRADAVVWVSWPKKASKMPTEVTEETIRAVALPLGFVDVKVCAVDDVWSGLKLVVRRSLRA